MIGFRTLDQGPPAPLNRAGVPTGKGYAATHAYREPPLVTAAVNMAWSTYTTMPSSIQGPGDVPLGQFLSWQGPTWVGAAYIPWGVPVSGGAYLTSAPTYMPAAESPLARQYF